MAIIEVRDLRKSYGATRAVDGIDLDVHEGEVLGVLGPNGAGKTTTVETVAGLRRPDSGTVTVAGLVPWRDRAEVTRVLGVQLQSAGLQARLTAREAVRLFAAFHDDPLDPDALLERLGLRDSAGTRYEALSGGQQQRLAIALALVGRPRVVLLDELTTGLDPQARRATWELVQDVREQGTTVVLVTHLMEEAERLCDRVVLVADGRVVAEGSPDEVVRGSGAPTLLTFRTEHPVPGLADALAALPGVRAARVAGPDVEVQADDDGVTAVLAHLHAAGTVPHRLRVVDSTLDDAYLDVVRRLADQSAATTTATATATEVPA
ncbi:ABC transporter ATP-binding protein [Angustibacter speluncae]